MKFRTSVSRLPSVGRDHAEKRAQIYQDRLEKDFRISITYRRFR